MTGGDVKDRTIGIFGVGMIGASLALSLKRAGDEREIFGFDLCPIPSGIVDRQLDSCETFIKQSDLIVLAVPLNALFGFFSTVRETVEISGKIISDVCSVKREVLKIAKQVFGELPPTLVPAHPLAGQEKSGPGSAIDSLFEGAVVVLTPHEKTAADAVEQVRMLWEAAGARVSRMDAKEHDRLLAATSHLPHVIACVVIDSVVCMHGEQNVVDFSAGSLRDVTRIAASDPDMWSEVCHANRDNLVTALRKCRSGLDRFVEYLENGDLKGIVKCLKYANKHRGALGWKDK